MKVICLHCLNNSILPFRLTMPTITSNFRILFCFLSIFISNHAFCQKLSPEVISSAGDISKNSSISLEWTLGETIIESSKTSNRQYTQGFHQSYLKVISILPAQNESLISDYNMTVYPNPVEAILEVKVSTENLRQDEIGKVDLYLFNFMGQQLLVQKINEESASTFVDMTAFPSGTYFLKAQKENGLSLKSFKITKVR